MAEPNDYHPTTSTPPQPHTSSSSPSGGENNEAAEFECNICFDLAQDPVITLCGHLYCWPCLYKWLRGHSHSHECPVCKALVEEEKVVPLYGRGKTPSDPRSKPVPGVEIPNRPAGQRPEMGTMPPHSDEYSNFGNLVMGLMGGFMPIASATFNNFGMSAGFGGVFAPFFNVQFNGFSGGGGYGGASGFNYGYGSNGLFRGGGDQGRANSSGVNQDARADDENLKKILLVIFLFVVFAFLTM